MIPNDVIVHTNEYARDHDVAAILDEYDEKMRQ